LKTAPTFFPTPTPSARPIAVVAAPVPMLVSGGNGTLTGQFRIVQANLRENSPVVSFGTFSNGTTVNVTKFGTKTPLSLDVSFVCCFSQVRLTYAGIRQIERTSPFALRGNIYGKYNEVPGLRRRGKKTILVEGMSNATNVVRTIRLVFYVVR
jgi:hypothetical protein